MRTQLSREGKAERTQRREAAEGERPEGLVFIASPVDVVVVVVVVVVTVVVVVVVVVVVGVVVVVSVVAVVVVVDSLDSLVKFSEVGCTLSPIFSPSLPPPHAAPSHSVKGISYD